MAPIPELEVQRLKEEIAVQRLIESAGIALKRVGKDLEVVAICEHLGLLGGVELVQEIGGEALAVGLDLLIEPLGRHAVQGGQVHVDHHLEAAHYLDAPLDARQQRAGRGHRGGSWFARHVTLSGWPGPAPYRAFARQTAVWPSATARWRRSADAARSLARAWRRAAAPPEGQAVLGAK